MAENGEPSAGAAVNSIGEVSLNVAVGNRSVSIACRRSWPSRRSSSLWRRVRSAVTSTAVIVVPANASVPVTCGVRPTASLARWLVNVSFTR